VSTERLDTLPAMQRPVLSVVAASRNDDHGGDLLGRMQAFVDGMAHTARALELSVELLLVEWNPPADSVPLADALAWPVEGRLSIRIVTVPATVHGALPNADRIRLHQMLAKNVGIRRAQGAFVLVTNVDVLCSDALAASLARTTLEPGRLALAVRHDVAVEPPLRERRPTEDLLDDCGAHVVAVHYTWGSEDLRSGRRDVIHHRRVERLPAPLRGTAHVLVEGPAATARVVREAWATPGDGGRLPTAVRVLREHWLLDRSGIRLHTNASGDFTLMAREDWERLRGYLELPVFPLHLDGLLVTAAHYAGVDCRLLDGPLFHFEHGDRFRPATSSPTGAPPSVTDADYRGRVAWMIRHQQPLILNPPEWGLARVTLPEAHASGRTPH
jgi:hypothetical protein